jgi:hypothetical protein
MGNPVGHKWLLVVPKHFRWTLHNLIAHPLGELCHLAGFDGASNWLHDATVPLHEAGKGRG